MRGLFRKLCSYAGDANERQSYTGFGPSLILGFLLVLLPSSGEVCTVRRKRFRRMEVAASTLCSNRSRPTQKSSTEVEKLHRSRPGHATQSAAFTRSVGQSGGYRWPGGPVARWDSDPWMFSCVKFHLQGRGRGRGEEAEREEGPVFGTRNVMVNNG